MSTYNFSVYENNSFKGYSQHTTKLEAEKAREKALSEGKSCSSIEYSNLNDDGDCDRWN